MIFFYLRDSHVCHIRPIFLGIGSTLLNVRIMYINVFIFIIYDIFLYS
nr:MAG TPA: hypothetical protein [Bacteriophage sp.]